MINCGVSRASLDFSTVTGDGIAVVSFFDRSLTAVKSVAASLNSSPAVLSGKRISNGGNKFDSYITPINYGKEKFYHCMSFNKKIRTEILLTAIEPEMQAHDLYNFLMENYDLPLLYEWAPVLLEQFIKKRLLVKEIKSLIKGENFHDSEIPFGERSVKVSKLCAFKVNLNEDVLKDEISGMIKRGLIKVCDQPQTKLSFTNMDSYFKNYGTTLVQNLEASISPLTELNGNIDYMVLMKKRLFPQQAANVNGICALLKRSRYGILNMGMGTGKTITSAAIVEGYFNQKYLARNRGSSLRDIYKDSNSICYRNIVMCPGHLVEKWVSELREEIPFAKVEILNDFSQLIEIKKNGKKRTEKEWYVLGKDFAKLSYQSIPVPVKERRKRIHVRACKKCGTWENTLNGKKFQCTSCGSNEYEIADIGRYATGLICPGCGEVLMSNGTLKFDKESDEMSLPLTSISFANQTSKNQRCHICGMELWKPYVKNINTPGTDWFEHANRNFKWYRATHYANKAHKTTKTVWVNEDYEEEYWEKIGERPLSEKRDDNGGTRRYAPASYIKKQLKGFFDFFIIDEAHLFKGGATAQGNAMHSLCKASKKQLALTGTIAGGMASHIFYLIYRLDPARMVKKGYSWSGEMEFTRKYGTIETEYEVSEDDYTSNKISKGKQIGSPKAKPGISPLIFSDFLLDKTVFLDLSDMSSYLPPFKEIVCSVPVEDESEWKMLSHYRSVIADLKSLSRDGEGKTVLSKMLQFSLSYLDHPYGVSPILSSIDGAVLARIEDFSELVSGDKLLAKEKELVRILSKELDSGRNCVVYAEFTGNPETCVTHRLKEIIQKNCELTDKQVQIIEANWPAASKREAYMHKKAAEGARVFIVNPKCVETGLDFCWEENGVKYNYPTLFFYQLGYSLFTIWQASRRSYRLNQTEECRVYYSAVKGTVQEAVISLIAEKQVATSAIQGKFSTEGLSAMAQGVDAKVKLAQAMADMDNISSDGLQSMFDVLNQEDSDNSTYADYVPMLTFHELMGDSVKEINISEENTINSFINMLNMFSFDNPEFHGKEAVDISVLLKQEEQEESKKKRRSAKKPKDVGQMSLFGF